MRIAVLGTGVVGRTIAAGLDDAGHDVAIGTRDPDAAMDREAGPREAEPYREWAAAHPAVTLANSRDAVATAAVVVNALPGAVAVDALRAIGEDVLGDRVLWDVANPLDFSHGFPPSLDPCGNDSLAEVTQRAFPNLRVVKALNTVNTSVMIPRGGPMSETHLPIAGDDDAAKATIAELLGDLGWADEQLLDLGGIEHARGMEGYLTLYFSLREAIGSASFNIRIVRADG